MRQANIAHGCISRVNNSLKLGTLPVELAQYNSQFAKNLRIDQSSHQIDAHNVQLFNLVARAQLVAAENQDAIVDAGPVLLDLAAGPKRWGRVRIEPEGRHPFFFQLGNCKAVRFQEVLAVGQHEEPDARR